MGIYKTGESILVMYSSAVESYLVNHRCGVQAPYISERTIKGFRSGCLPQLLMAYQSGMDFTSRCIFLEVFQVELLCQST